MGKGGSQSTTSTELPAWLQTNLQSVYNRANTLSQQPLSQYTAPLVAGFAPSQNAAFNTINNAQGISAPFTNAAAQYTAQSAQGPTASDIARYQSPYTQQVVDTTQAQLNQNNAIQQQQLQGRAIQSGASPFGGDRAGVAAAALAGQQKMADNSTIANLYNQGYGQALGQYNTTAGMQANAGQAMNQYGTTALNNALTGANAQLQSGNQQQQLAQNVLNVPYQQYQQALQYPYQQLGVLEQATGLAGGLAGGTSKTTSNYASGGVAHFANGGIPDISIGYIPQSSFTMQGANISHPNIQQAPQAPKPESPLQQGANVASTIKSGKELYGYGKDAANWASGKLGLDKAALDTSTHAAAAIAPEGSIAATPLEPLVASGPGSAAGVAASTIPESQVGVLSAPLAGAAAPAASTAATAAIPSIEAGVGTGLEAGAAEAGAGASGLLSMAGPIGIGAALALPILGRLFHRASGGVVADDLETGVAAHRPTASAAYPTYGHFADGGDSDAGSGVATHPAIATPQLDISKLNGQDTTAQNFFNPLPQIDRNQQTYAPISMNNPAAYMGYGNNGVASGVSAPIYGASTTNAPTTNMVPVQNQGIPVGVPSGAKPITTGSFAGMYAVQGQSHNGQPTYKVYDSSGNSVLPEATTGLWASDIGFNKGGVAHFADGGVDDPSNATDLPITQTDTPVPYDDNSNGLLSRVYGSKPPQNFNPLPPSQDLENQKDPKSSLVDKDGEMHIQHGGETIKTGIPSKKQTGADLSNLNEDAIPSRGLFGMSDEAVAGVTAGLSALAGSSKSPLVNLSRGALAGIGEYGASREQAIKNIQAQNEQRLKQQQLEMGKYIASRNPITGQMEGVFNAKTGQWEQNPNAGMSSDINEYAKNIGIQAKPIQGRADITKTAALMDSAGKAVPQLNDGIASIQRVKQLLPKIDQGLLARAMREGEQVLGVGTPERAAYEEIAKLEGNLALNNELSQGVTGSRLGFRMAELGQKIFANPEMTKDAQLSILDKSLKFAEMAKNSNEVLPNFEGSSSGTLAKVKQDYYNQSLKYGTPIPTEDYLAGKHKNPNYKPPASQPIMGGANHNFAQTPKVITQSDIANTAQNYGKTVEQVTQDAKAKGYVVQ